jgi:polysaccharide export outer membrane protein
MNQGVRSLPAWAWAARLLALLVLCAPAWAQSPASGDYPLAAGDVVRVQVFQNPDLTLETRISESGTISYPLIGTVRIGGLTVATAERRIAEALRSGGFLQSPQVTLLLTQVRGSQVSVLGQVGRPGRFPLENANTRLSDMLANAGGTTPGGDDVVIVSGLRDGKPFRRLIDLPALFLRPGGQDDVLLQGGDVVYVHRAPLFYVFGEAQRPGAFRIERDMTVMQAIAQAGGPTPRGSLRRLQLHRRNGDDGSVKTFEPEMTDKVQPNDVLQVRESLF